MSQRENPTGEMPPDLDAKYELNTLNLHRMVGEAAITVQSRIYDLVKDEWDITIAENILQQNQHLPAEETQLLRLLLAALKHKWENSSVFESFRGRETFEEELHAIYLWASEYNTDNPDPFPEEAMRALQAHFGSNKQQRI